MSQNVPSDPKPERAKLAQGCLDRIAKNALTILVVIVVGGILFSLARAAVYKIRPYERGLHLRGGRFVNVDEPGWHTQIPFVDTVRYQLEVWDPDAIVAGYVQGTLRDVVNTRHMDEVMHSRAEINAEVMAILKQKQGQYGVEFILVQIQNAAPPSEVVDAIKNRMVAVQLQEQAEAEAQQQKTLADSQYYASQKQADGDAYQTITIAEAQAEALRIILQELEDKGPLGEKYIQVLIAQELRENSKWIISDGESMPILDLEGTTAP